MTEFTYEVTLLPFGLGDTKRWIRGRVQAATTVDACERLFELFNTGQQPEGFRSMSTGDIVSLSKGKKHLSVYVDTLVCMPQGWSSLHGPVEAVEEDGANWPA